MTDSVGRLERVRSKIRCKSLKGWASLACAFAHIVDGRLDEVRGQLVGK